MTTMLTEQTLEYTDRFVRRHVGPGEAEMRAMLELLGYDSLDALMEAAVPEQIRLGRELKLPAAATEHEALAELRRIAAQNRVFRSFLGLGYHDTITPPVILRNVIENPGWYTAYTPYQAEIAQGRLEALLNFQTMVMDLTGLPIANASLLDEGTAAAEAVAMAHAAKGGRQGERTVFFVSELCHPQTIDVVKTRSRARGWEIVVGDHRTFELTPSVFGALVQYPATDGEVVDYSEFVERVHAANALAVVAADPMALTVLTPPGEWGADVAVGSTQRFGVPMGYGGPHAAYFATKDEYKRQLPGRIIGVSTDSQGEPALRMALQTREQHIRREKATSNICTSQVLLAVVASMYAVYHGPEGLRAIGERLNRLARALASGATKLGLTVAHEAFFETVRLEVGAPRAEALVAAAEARGINLRRLGEGSIVVAMNEPASAADIEELLEIFNGDADPGFSANEALADAPASIPAGLQRKSAYLTHPVFNRYHSETEMMRYLHRLEARDLALNTAMIPLGSCTMKLNAAAEMEPITWPEFANIHPFAPRSQAQGYRVLFEQLEAWLSEITGYARVSLQPNAGSQGELTGLLVIRAYHEARAEGHRDVCLIPHSAHGTNPASAVMAGLEVVVVDTDEQGNVDLGDLKAKAERYADRLAALMVTYPSTHGVFEETITQLCAAVHDAGGQVYVDGANLNALVGLAQPGRFGADVSHLNLHKTFCIPHGGGGPGVGPVAVREHLTPFLPRHPVLPDISVAGAQTGDVPAELRTGPVAAAPYGSAGILPISYTYLRLMGADGLRTATQVAILNANYVARRLDQYFPVLYTGQGGLVAHECILDLRHITAQTGITAEDVAKRLIDYGFHAPTLSFPVPGTLMVEPTESENLGELDRFCAAMISIRQEIARVAAGDYDREDNPLTNAPHTAQMLLA
ncbi:MAG TPA: aminomethyl-transferring glycine dehydrogenase, partial [Longimicrobiales bacterium]